MACYGPQRSRSNGSDSAGMAASGPRNSTEAGGRRLEVLMRTLLMGALLVGLTPAAPNLFLAGSGAAPGTPDRHPSAAAAPGTPVSKRRALSIELQELRKKLVH